MVAVRAGAVPFVYFLRADDPFVLDRVGVVQRDADGLAGRDRDYLLLEVRKTDRHGCGSAGGRGRLASAAREDYGGDGQRGEAEQTAQRAFHCYSSAPCLRP